MATFAIIGAGPGGATTALLLARRGHGVTILDGDWPTMPAGGGWTRPGVIHARQGHTFLARGTQVLRAEAADIVDALASAGAVAVPLRHHPEEFNLLCRRVVFDEVLRGVLREQAGVETLPGVVATGLRIEPASATAPPRVLGIETARGVIRADFVVDAAGRRSPVPRWLRALGIEIDVVHDATRFAYVTRHYRLRAGAVFPSLRIPFVVALEYASVLAFPEDNGHYQITIQCDIRDPARRALRGAEVFQRFVASIPTMAPWVDAGDPVDEPEVLSSFGNDRRRVFTNRALVHGLVLAGDAAMQTNPTAGRGVALALAQAFALASTVDRVDGDAVTQALEEANGRVLYPWFESQLQVDRERYAQFRAALEGRTNAVAADVSGRIASALYAVDESSGTAAAGERLFNLLCTPEEIWTDRHVMRLVLRESRRRPGRRVAEGPSRVEYERMMKVSLS